MIFSETKLPGVLIVEPDRRVDERGFFARTWCAREMKEHGLSPALAQANIGFTHRKGGLRGLHYQLAPHRETKLVRCTRGALFDVVVDLRPDSSTYCEWVGAELTADNRRMMYLPEGCAHGYQTLMDDTELFYQTSESYAPDFARGVRYDDEAFSIVWPLAVTSISPADLSWPDYHPESDAAYPFPLRAGR